MLEQISVDGEDFIGLLGMASDKYAILAPNFPDQECLNVPAVKMNVYGTSLVGIFAQGNSNGLLLPYSVSEKEEREIREFIEPLGVSVEKMHGKHTSLGNLIALNDKAAIVSPVIDDLLLVEDVLDVEVICMDLAGSVDVGTNLVATNRGFIANQASFKMVDNLKEIFGVDGGVGTVNYGVPYPATGIIANSNGALTGARTTGIEMGRIDKCLGFL